MRNLKKFLALVLAMMMALSLMVTVNAANFDDHNEISPVYQEAVSVLKELDIVQGDPGFRPKDTITRAEVAAILYRLYTGDGKGKYLDLYKGYTEFNDVNKDLWYAPYINFCYNNGLVTGRSIEKKTYDPKGNVTGYETLVMVLRAIGYNNPEEFTTANWKFKASGYGQRLGLTKNINTASLDGAIKREMVAEIMYRAMQVPIVQYTMLSSYQPARILIPNDEVNRVNYSQAIAYGVVELPLYENLMYRNWGIVGQSPKQTFDAYGRPSYVWVTDDELDSVTATINAADENLGNATKYVPNVPAKGETWDDMIPNDDQTKANMTTVADWLEDKYFSLKVAPLAVYHNAVLECDVAKVISENKTLPWANIIEVLNGNAEAVYVKDADGNDTDDRALTATTYKLAPKTVAEGGSGHSDDDKFDAQHTSVNYIGATGRTTEIYLIKSTGHFVFVYVDTLLGQVTDVVDAIKDTGGHTIRDASASVRVLGGAEEKIVSIKTTSVKKGDLVLLQTNNMGKETDDELAITDTDPVYATARAPLYPTDVPYTRNMFSTSADYVGLAKKVTVKIEGTVGTQDAKMGVMDEKGITYYASNTFLAGRARLANTTVLDEYYDVDNENLGITNSMIGRTYELVLDKNDYIVGMKEVASAASVGVITGYEGKRIGTGRFLTTVEAYMTDGTTQSFDVAALIDGTDDKHTLSTFDPTIGVNDSYGYYPTMSDAEQAWSDINRLGEGTYDGKYGWDIGIGSLVKFRQVTLSDGYAAWCIDDWAVTNTTGNDYDNDDDNGIAFNDPMIPNTGAKGEPATGLALKDDRLGSGSAEFGALTGVTNTLDDGTTGGNNAPVLNSESVIFVAEYDFRYNTAQGQNTGSNRNKTYTVYNGFKKMPTITGTNWDDPENPSNVLWQRLQKAENKQYVLIYAKDPTKEYFIRQQDTIPVDESYLVLSQDVTYAAYSEYTVLKNGVKQTLQVANNNTGVNLDMQNAMENGNLIVVTSRNTASGYVTAIGLADMAASTGFLNAGGWWLDVTIDVNGDDEADMSSIISGDFLKDKKGSVACDPGTDVLKIDFTGDGKYDHYMTIADNCKVMIVNRDQKVTTTTDLATAVIYANGVGNLNKDRHDLVFELDANGYICTLYVMD